jgi:hypothetical protein
MHTRLRITGGRGCIQEDASQERNQGFLICRERRNACLEMHVTNEGMHPG